MQHSYLWFQHVNGDSNSANGTMKGLKPIWPPPWALAAFLYLNFLQEDV